MICSGETLPGFMHTFDKATAVPLQLCTEIRRSKADYMEVLLSHGPISAPKDTKTLHLDDWLPA